MVECQASQDYAGGPRLTRRTPPPLFLTVGSLIRVHTRTLTLSHTCTHTHGYTERVCVDRIGGICYSYLLLWIVSVFSMLCYTLRHVTRCLRGELHYCRLLLSETSDRMFLSWQTWDLLCFMYYGFVGFCEQFLKQHPGYTIHPIHLSGSATETLFRQLKYASAGNLMSTNYASARASILIKGCVSGKYKGDDYRDVPLFVRQHQLKKSK